MTLDTQTVGNGTDATHCCTLDAPVDVAYVLTGQLIQDVALEFGLYVPVAHGVQFEAPGPAEYVPAGHGRHAPLLLLPVVGR